MAELDWGCHDCGTSVGDEYAYMVEDEVWPIGEHDGLLCIGCLEDRLGRRLQPEDFPQRILLNSLDLWDKSPRLRNRMFGEES